MILRPLDKYRTFVKLVPLMRASSLICLPRFWQHLCVEGGIRVGLSIRTHVCIPEGGRCLEHASRETALPGITGFCGHTRSTSLCVARVAWQRAAKCTNYGPPLVVDDARSSAKNHSCHGRLHFR